MERGRLDELERKVEAKKAQLEAKAKVLAEDRVAFKSLEMRSREALQELYEKGLEKTLMTDDDGPAQLLPQLVTVLEDVVNGIGPMVEGEVHALSSSALTRVLSHLHLRDPNADLGVLLELVDEERCTAAAKAMKGEVEALLKKFLAIDSSPPADGAANPSTKADDTGDSNVAHERALPDDGVQGRRGGSLVGDGAPSCFYFPANFPATCDVPRGGVKTLVWCLRNNMFSNISLRFHNLLLVFLMFYICSARPRAYLSHRWTVRITRTRPRGEGLRGQLGS